MHLAKERDRDTRFAQDALASAGIGVIRIVKTRTFPAESEGLALAQEYAIKIPVSYTHLTLPTILLV